tara:strand:- start:162 stop:1070 length:909 start_codon:yes stop_codon:yes gene_type:complete
MILYKNSNLNKKYKRSIVAIGNFDGLHLGHQKVLREAKLKAKTHKTKFGVITFEPLPVMFFNKKIKNYRINNLNQKIKGFKKINLDFLKVIKFNKKFSKLSPENFIKNIIFKNLNAKYIYISKNFRFGRNRSGDIRTLIKNEKFYSYRTIVAKPLKSKNKILSSTIIRKNISKGKIKRANKLLGREWTVSGKVIEGSKRGKKIGFPTCNIELKDYIIPRLGVYAVSVEYKTFKRRGIANIGYRPTFNGKKLLLEVNIFGIKKNLYKKDINVNFLNFIRDEKKFKSVDELKKQIKRDIKKAKN